MIMTEKQLSFSPRTHALDNNDNFSPDGKFIAFPHTMSATWGSEGVDLTIDENRAGLSFAREQGIHKANYDIVLFCDDDNWLDENYVSYVFHNFEIKQK